MLNPDTCGIEVSARTLLVLLRRENKLLGPRSFPNTPAGHRQILRFLGSPGEVRVCLEATGNYGLDLALALSQAPNLEVMVANPKVMRRYAEALRSRSKTDLLDVFVIEDFALRMPFQRWCPPEPQVLHLRALSRRLQEMARQRTAERNRLHAANVTTTTPTVLRDQLKRSLEFLEKDQQTLLKAALELIQQDPALHTRYQLLLSIKGIGSLSALLILGELAPLGDHLTARQWVAFAGLDPCTYQSGSSVHRKPRISKVGNVHLRRALYMPALNAIFRDPGFISFYQKLLGRGKLPLQAICAAMRKMLHAIYGMFRHGQPYDASRLFAQQLDPTQKPNLSDPTDQPKHPPQNLNTPTPPLFCQ